MLESSLRNSITMTSSNCFMFILLMLRLRMETFSGLFQRDLLFHQISIQPILFTSSLSLLWLVLELMFSRLNCLLRLQGLKNSEKKLVYLLLSLKCLNLFLTMKKLKKYRLQFRKKSKRRKRRKAKS